MGVLDGVSVVGFEVEGACVGLFDGSCVVGWGVEGATAGVLDGSSVVGFDVEGAYRSGGGASLRIGQWVINDNRTDRDLIDLGDLIRR